MEGIPHLATGALEAEGSAAGAYAGARSPNRRRFPIRRPELPRAGQHAAAVYPHREAEGLTVFESDRFRGQLGAAVQRNRRRGGECFANASQGNARRQRRGAIQLKSAAANLERQRAKRRNRIHAAAAQQDEAGFVPLRVFEHVHQAGQIMLEQLPAAQRAFDARQHARRGL